MKLSKSVLLSLLAISPSMVSAMLPIHVKSFRFIKPSSPENEAGENEIFYVKGVDYQPGGSSAYDADSNSDVLSDADQCARDAFVFQQLGINTLRAVSYTHLDVYKRQVPTCFESSKRCLLRSIVSPCTNSMPGLDNISLGFLKSLSNMLSSIFVSLG